MATAIIVAEFCRLCATKKQADMKNVCLEEYKNYQVMIYKILSVEVKEDDHLPKHICMECEEKINSWQDFYLQCSRNQVFLNQLCLLETAVEFSENIKDETNVVVKEEYSFTNDTASPLANYNDDTNYEADAYIEPEDSSENPTISQIKELKTTKYRKSKESIRSKHPVRRRGTSNITNLIEFICHVCKIRVKNLPKLQKHCKISHNEKLLVFCTYCGAGIRSQSALYSHLSAHKDEGFLCDICSHVSQSQEALEKHKRLKHTPETDKKYQCSTCDKIFESKQLLISHLKSHIPLAVRKIHKCDFCDRKFISRGTMLGHMRSVHENIKRFVCDLCGFSCATHGELKQHRPVHSDEKPFACSKCGKGFKTKTNLKTHMDIHEDTAYECHICRRILNSRRTLRKHLVVHQSECRFFCAYCKKAFKRRETLKTHLSVHTGDKPFACKHCDERFTYASTLRAHRLRYHSDKPLQSSQHNPMPHTDQLHCISYAPEDNTEVSLTVSKQEPVKQGYLRIDWS